MNSSAFDDIKLFDFTTWISNWYWMIAWWKLTCRGIHGAAIADNDTVPAEALSQGEVRILYLHHRLQQIFLELNSCKKETKKQKKCNQLRETRNRIETDRQNNIKYRRDFETPSTHNLRTANLIRSGAAQQTSQVIKSKVNSFFFSWYFRVINTKPTSLRLNRASEHETSCKFMAVCVSLRYKIRPDEWNVNATAQITYQLFVLQHQVAFRPRFTLFPFSLL